MIPAWLQLPKVLADSAYRNPIDPLRCGIQPAHNTTDHLFKWLPKNPSILKDFNLYMTSLRVGHAHWLDFYPFQEQVYKGIPDPLEEQIVFVDVGGAVGHEILEIRKRNPGLVGRMVLQDLPKTLEQVTAGPAMLETMSHDFFTPQPCQGKSTSTSSPSRNKSGKFTTDSVPSCYIFIAISSLISRRRRTSLLLPQRSAQLAR